MKHFSRRSWTQGLLAAMLGLSALASQAQEGAPAKIIVGFPAGGSFDAIARLIAEKAKTELNRPIVVDNKAGAGGRIAVDALKGSPADGSVVMLGPDALTSLYPFTFKKLNYDPKKDLVPIGTAAEFAFSFAVGSNPKVNSWAEYVAWAKANPGKVSFGSAGQGASKHLSGELLNALAGIRMQHIPYKGDAPSLADLISGQIQVALPTTVAGLPFVTSVKLRAIGVTGAKRLDNMPDLPTVAETLRGFEAVSWGGVMVPAGTPKPVVARLNADINRILKMPDVADKLKALGAVIVGSSPEEFDAYVKDEIAKWGKVARENNIALD